MSSPSFNRCSLPCGRLPSRPSLYLLFTLTLLCLQLPLVTSQSLEIRKTIKEELLPGDTISDLPNEPEFAKIITLAESSGTVSKTPNSGNQLQYSILTSGNPNSQYFAVDKSTGVVAINRNIDREHVCSFRDDCHLHFEVAARSAYGVFFQLVDFDITVTDINDNPPEFTQHHFDLYIPEHSELGRSFQLPTAFDRDTGVGNGVSEYKILKGPQMFGLREQETNLNTSDVFLTLESTVTREDAVSYKVLVGAVDGGIPPLTGTLTVEVQVSDINDNFPIFEQSVYRVKVPEDTRNDQVIQQVSATDADTGPNGQLTYAFSAQQPQEDLNYFRMEPKTGEIFLSKSLESRTGQEIELLVEASDKGHPPKVSRARVKIFIEDTINSMPDIIIDTLGGAKGVTEVSEYAEVGKVVAHVSVKDPDSGENGRTDCTLNSKEFKLITLDDAGKYKAILTTDLDREIISMYNLTVSCTDHGFPALLAMKDFTVAVLDENDQKPVFSQRTYEASVYENNTVGAEIAQLTVTDGDIGQNAEVFFTVIGINQQYFTVNPEGKMLAKVALDREYSERIVATVEATDRGDPPLSSSATVVVNLLDINDMRPKFNQMIYEFEVEEEKPLGRFVGIVKAEDKDSGINQELFYHLPSSYAQQDMKFEVGIKGGVIKTTETLDREKQEKYDFIVLATDKGTPPLTGTASVIIRVLDINDNDPYFLYPSANNNTLSIPHTFEAKKTIVNVIAHDDDSGLNAEIIYSVNNVNTSAPFAVDPSSGALILVESLSADEVGSYILTLMANDKGLQKQRATQAPLYIDVFFDNSTLLGAVSTAGPSREIIMVLIVLAVLIILAVVIVVTIVCIRRRKLHKKQNGGVPNSASSSSTTKLQGGYYIAPGVRGSSSSFLAKPEEGTCNNNVNHDSPDGVRTSNPYVVMVPRSENDTPGEIIEISRSGHPYGMSDTLNTVDLDRTDDGQFSTFKSEEDILSPGLRQGSLPRRHDPNSSIAKHGNDTFDEMSNDDSTSDSGRGGSDVDVNNGGAAAAKARAQAATPISVKSGICNRLSPLPRDMGRTFVTFRGDSPSSFRFDSDSDTLPRNTQRAKNTSTPMTSSPSRSELPRYDQLSMPRATIGAGRLSESDTDTEISPRSRFQPPPGHIAGIYSPNTSATGYSSGGETGPSRLPLRVAPLPMFNPPSTYHRPDSETEHSDGGSNPSSSLSRRNHIPRLPAYPGIEFTHHAYGAPSRNSVGAFSNSSGPTNHDVYYPDYDQNGSYYTPSANGMDYNSLGHNSNSSGGVYDPINNPWAAMPGNRMTESYGNVVSELQESRPVSMEEDALLPPYPEVDEEEENLHLHSGFTGLSPERDAERAALFSRSRFESSA